MSMRILITGADGFIGKNLHAQLKERPGIEIVCFTRNNQNSELLELLKDIDFVFHCAGVNRTTNIDDFKKVNREVTLALCEALSKINKKIPIVYTSSTQADLSNPYGASKRDAELALQDFALKQESPVYIYRLPNVFGKWSRPNYNSAVATFCYNIAHDLDVHIHDPTALVSLVYIDDVINHFVRVMDGKVSNENDFCTIEPVYKITVGDLVKQIRLFKESRTNLVTEQVGKGFARALYSTYVSFLSPKLFAYELPEYRDPRGVFVEMLKTKDSGQFSYFTAPPGITRGGHYHHSKTEKFLVIKGKVKFRFKQLMTNEYYEVETSGDMPQVVDTIPGWIHDITNIGEDEMIVMLWANEIFDRDQPDTYACEI
jgi:UDP-2-acetamido-2,6-beta-L-arabino-hexul-4-ose reductase